MRYCLRFPRGIPHQEVDYPRVTHPYATVLRDCSPFSFDLHVLSAPPALILSRDQTLIYINESRSTASACPCFHSGPAKPVSQFFRSLRFTQSSDEVFFTASNQIVKDLCEPPPISVNTGSARRPRNLLTAPPAERAHAMKNFEAL